MSSSWVLLILHYKYLIIFPLAVFEGPILALFIGFLSHLGYFNLLLTYMVLLAADFLPDVAYYILGRYGNRKGFWKKHVEKLPWLSGSLEKMRSLWKEKGLRTMFLTKLSYGGVAVPLLMSAGLVGMPFKRFVSYALPIGMIQCGVFLFLGYYLGKSYVAAESYIKFFGIGLAVILLVIVGGHFWLGKYVTQIIKKTE